MGDAAKWTFKDLEQRVDSINLQPMNDDLLAISIIANTNADSTLGIRKSDSTLRSELVAFLDKGNGCFNFEAYNVRYEWRYILLAESGPTEHPHTQTLSNA